MLLYNGTRISEFLDLKKENVHLEEQYFDVIDSKTENGIRKVPIADKLLPYYKDWYESCPDCEYLLHTEDGKSFSIAIIMTAIGLLLWNRLELTVHHIAPDTPVSPCYQKQAFRIQKSKKLWHSGAMTLTEKVYTHLDMQVLVDAINKTLEEKDSIIAEAESA